MRRSASASSGPCVPTRRKPQRAVVEAIEPRLLLSVTQDDNPYEPFSTFIDGHGFLDNNSNGLLDAGDTPLPNQTVALDQVLLGHDAGAITTSQTSTGQPIILPTGVFGLLAAGEYQLPDPSL